MEICTSQDLCLMQLKLLPATLEVGLLAVSGQPQVVLDQTFFATLKLLGSQVALLTQTKIIQSPQPETKNVSLNFSSNF